MRVSIELDGVAEGAEQVPDDRALVSVPPHSQDPKCRWHGEDENCEQ